MIGLLCVFLLSDAVVNLTDGQLLRGDLKSISDGQVVLSVDQQERVLDVAAIKKLSVSNREVPTLERTVTLRDGSVLAASAVRISQKGSAEIGRVVCPVNLLHSARFFRSNPELVNQWQEILSNAGSDDYLVINKKGNLDYLGGTIISADADKVVFNYSGSSLDVPLQRVAGLVFAKKAVPRTEARFSLTVTDGSVWQLSNLRSVGKKLELVSVGGATYQVGMERVASIEFMQTGAVYLSDLKAANAEYKPYLGSSLVGNSLQALGMPRMDKSFDDNPIQIADDDGTSRTFKRGVAMQSRSELTYRLAGKYRKFQAIVGFDPEASLRGHVELKLLADDKEIFRQLIAQNDKPIKVDLPLRKVNRLRILVDYGENLDIGDRIHLGDARLIK